MSVSCVLSLASSSLPLFSFLGSVTLSFSSFSPLPHFAAPCSAPRLFSFSLSLSRVHCNIEGNLIIQGCHRAWTKHHDSVNTGCCVELLYSVCEMLNNNGFLIYNLSLSTGKWLQSHRLINVYVLEIVFCPEGQTVWELQDQASNLSLSLQYKCWPVITAAIYRSYFRLWYNLHNFWSVLL